MCPIFIHISLHCFKIRQFFLTKILYIYTGDYKGNLLMTKISNSDNFVFSNRGTVNKLEHKHFNSNNIKFNHQSKSSMPTVATVGIGVAVLYGLLAVGDLVFTKGKNLKKAGNLVKTFVSKLKNREIKTSTTNVQEISTTKPFSFLETTEGKRLSSMKNEELEQEIIKRGNSVFEELNIPENVQPQIRLNNKEGVLGYFESRNNTINISSDAIYKLDHVIMHEASHAREALLRGCLTTEQRNNIVKNELMQRIIKGNDSINVPLDNISLIGRSMRSPIIPLEMRKDFAEFINKYMLRENSETKYKILRYFEKNEHLKLAQCEEDKIKIPQFLSELQSKSELSELKSLIHKNPKFVEQYASEKEALEELYRYSYSFSNRFEYPTVVTNNNGKILKLYEHPTPQQMHEAEQSLKNWVRTIDGETNNIFGRKLNLNEYMFSPEELLCEQKGSRYAIGKLKKQLEELKNTGKLSEQEEQYINSKIKDEEEYIKRLTKNSEKYYVDKGYSI